MNRIQILARMTYGVGILVLAAIAFSVLALADIARGEPDLSLEWGTLRVTALLILMYLGLSFATIRALVRRGPDPDA